MNAIKAVLATVTVWHVAGKVNLTKCNFTGKFIKNAIGQVEYDNVIVVNSFKKVNASINWAAICGSLLVAILIVLLVVFAVAMSFHDPKTPIFSALIVGLFGGLLSLIITDNRHFTVEIA